MPKWWKAYNDSKHNLPDGYKTGSIENTYLALAGLYLLHAMMQQYPRNKDDFLKQDFWMSYKPLVISGGKGYSYECTIAESLSEIFRLGISFGQGEY